MGLDCRFPQAWQDLEEYSTCDQQDSASVNVLVGRVGMMPWLVEELATSDLDRREV
ncbi:hypothetical protein TIFTF001_055502 [Ficus carica]|uniref:Uncharacterized protein n=2 Tax=Ficus carica TaxID=3494 RepID=A0AA88JBR4_FICCA|nr:hypothetical protein TIFTF001_055501 [Ficus carica]GMN71028.1 hypothetical protein TIFTF001_055502 [Ficus carica]